jgi:hypothetical protein
LIFLKLRGKLEIKKFDELVPHFERHIANRTPYACIMDFREAKGANDPRIGLYWSKWTKPRLAEIEKYCIGTSMCIDSFVLKTIANAVLKIVAPPHPSAIENRLASCLTHINKWAAAKETKLPAVDKAVWKAL